MFETSVPQTVKSPVKQPSNGRVPELARALSVKVKLHLMHTRVSTGSYLGMHHLVGVGY